MILMFGGIWALTLSSLGNRIRSSSRSEPFSLLTSNVNYHCWLLCPRRSAPPCGSSGIRATGLLLLPISWTFSQRHRRSKKPVGGRGTQAESRQREPSTSSRTQQEGTGWPHHVLEPKALHSLLSHRHLEPDGGQLPQVRSDGPRSGEPRIPAGRIPAAAGLAARYAASAAGAPSAAAASPPPPSPSSPPPPPVLVLFFILLLLFIRLGQRSSSSRSGSRRALPRAPRGTAVLRSRRRVLQRRHRERRRPAVLPGDGERRRGGSGGVVQQPGAPIPDK